MPSGRDARVRSIHAQNRPSEIGRAGERCAIISRTSKRPRSRAATGSPIRARSCRRRVSMSRCGRRAIRRRSRTACRFTCISAPRTRPRASSRSHLDARNSSSTNRFALRPGDRFIVRDAQATRTIGGGTVLDPVAASAQRRAHASPRCDRTARRGRRRRRSDRAGTARPSRSPTSCVSRTTPTSSSDCRPTPRDSIRLRRS